MATSVSQGIFDSLFNLYMAIALAVGAAVIGWLFYNLWAFRARPESPRPFDAPVAGMLPAERGRPIWSWALAIGIAAIMFGLAFSTISAVNTIEIPPKDREWNHHNVTGFQFGWKYDYVGVGGIPFQKIGDWTVPVDTVIVLNVTSQDVWHNYALTDFRIRVDAIPGEVNTMWFEAQQTGEYSNVCVQICGTSHALMKASMDVVTQEEYRTWLARESDSEFNKLQNSIFRDTRRGTVVNVTIGEDAIIPQSHLVPGRPVVFNVTNAGSGPATVTAGGNAVTVPPGASARLYAMAPASGGLAFTTSAGQSATFQVVSR